MKQILPHIHIATDDEGRVRVTVDGYWLFDFIEDFLIEDCDLPYEYVEPVELNGRATTTMYFPLSVRQREVEAHLLKIAPHTTEQINRSDV